MSETPKEPTNTVPTTPASPKKKKTGGRPKGTPNRNTWVLRQSLEDHGFDPVKEFIELFKATADSKDKLDRLTWLFRYVFPQLKEIDAPAQSTQPVTPPASSQASTESLLSLVKPSNK